MKTKAQDIHLRHVLLWLFDSNREITGTAAAKEINQVYGNGAINDATCRKWLSKFKSGERSVQNLEDEPRSGRPSEINEDHLSLEVRLNPTVTCRELAEKFDASISTIDSHLHAIGMVCETVVLCFLNLKYFR